MFIYGYKSTQLKQVFFITSAPVYFQFQRGISNTPQSIGRHLRPWGQKFTIRFYQMMWQLNQGTELLQQNFSWMSCSQSNECHDFSSLRSIRWRDGLVTKITSSSNTSEPTKGKKGIFLYIVCFAYLFG